ncbi:phospholipase-like protein [Tanacetum coccineum]
MLSCQIDDENDDNENVPLNYYINNDLSIQFGREEFCLVTGLRFGVEHWEEYDARAHLPFRRHVFPSVLDGQSISGFDIANAILSPTFADLYNEDVVAICCLVILQLVLAPLLCRPDMQRLSYDTPNGWLAGEHMNSWVELMIRRRPLNANWTVAYTSTISVHPENNQFIIMNDPHVIGTLDGSTRPYPSWNNVDWVFLPIHVAGNHWATGVIHLASSHFYVFDSMYSRGNYDVISKLIECWTPVLNRILEDRGCFNGTRRPYNFDYSYNQASSRRCEDTRDCGYD